jgi:SsrA-binding protein
MAKASAKAHTAAEPVKKEYRKSIALNRKARFEYHVDETLDAGVELLGSEVKSLRQGKVDFSDAYARVRGGELILLGLHITTYDKTFVQAPDPRRNRRLLLRKGEIRKLEKKQERQGVTFIPLEVFFKGSWVKVKLGVCRGKARADKREDVKTKDVKRDLDRVKKNARASARR